MPSTATCNGATIRTSSWKDQSDLAMVRDWLYPHKSKNESQHLQQDQHSQVPDPYNPIVSGQEYEAPLDQNTQSHTPHTRKSNIININKRKAVDRIRIYQCHDTHVPHALSATASLVDAQLHYDERYIYQLNYEHPNYGAGISTESMKSIMAMSFCRFVNGFVDRDVVTKSKVMRESGLSGTKPEVKHGQPQTGDIDTTNDTGDNEEDEDDDFNLTGTTQNIPKNTGESSMYKHATLIGMPATFVDLRHRATHSREGPTLRELQRGVDGALEWLWNHWWKVNARGDSTVRLWEFERWEEAMEKFARSKVGALEEGNVDGGVEDDDSTEIDAGDEDFGPEKRVKWKSVTEDGVTRFVQVH